jgi:hypothetical protein
MKPIKITRKELYDLVWRESLPSISKKYNVSYYDLRKTCVKMNIPLPKAGYWQNLWLGNKIFIEPLSDSYSGQQECTLNLLEEGDVRTKKVKAAAIIQKEKIEEDTKLNFSVPSKLSKPDALVESARKNLNKKPWSFGHGAGLVTCSGNIFDISVSPQNVDRALRFMDAFIKLLKSRSNSITSEHGKTYAVVEGEKVKISIKEKSKRFVFKETNGFEKSEYKPTGILSFKMVIFYKETEWKDSKLPLEDQVSVILSTMEVKAREHKQLMLSWENKREKEAEARRLIKQQEELKAKELAAFKSLIEEAQVWHHTVILREYIDKVETRALAKSSPSEDLKTWLLWARGMADAHDPLNNDYKPYFEK